ncbi:MAG TPA: 50S ribosomal protein L9 [Candidatus Brocadiia bacterium]|nr:50S ribosomal protein L9 [Candidatus Brocadiia bacterium]
MQVLLRKNVEKLGQIGDIVNVKLGYARNFLLPRGFAMEVTPVNLKVAEAEKRKHQEMLKKRDEELAQLAKRLNGASVTISSAANAEGHLFGSVSAQQIATALSDEGFAVDAKMLQLADPLKEVGVYDVVIQLKADLTATCKVWVVGE